MDVEVLTLIVGLVLDMPYPTFLIVALFAPQIQVFGMQADSIRFAPQLRDVLVTAPANSTTVGFAQLVQQPQRTLLIDVEPNNPEVFGLDEFIQQWPCNLVHLLHQIPFKIPGDYQTVVTCYVCHHEQYLPAFHINNKANCPPPYFSPENQECVKSWIIIIMGQSSVTTQQDKQTFEELVSFISNKIGQYALISTEKERQRLSHSFLDSIKSEYTQKILGCLFGAIIGDVLGAYCQFNTTNLTEQVLEKTMQMNGGGVFKLHKGQFTDDSELAYHLLKALTTLNYNQPLASQTQRIILRISEQYIEWGKSNPFDIGITCRKGIDVLGSLKAQRLEVKELLARVKEVTGKSQSNGSLMRIAPMACFFALLQENPEDYREFVENQIGLIHNNQVLREAGFIWVKVLYELIRRKDNDKSTYLSIFNKAQKSAKGEQIKQWFMLAKQEEKISAVQNMGWAKIAWTYGMSLLYNLATTQNCEFSYYNKIKDVISQGGDSDTNAAIVGGMLGAIVGFRSLPTPYLSTIFQLQFPQEQHKIVDRPKKYEPLNVLLELLHLKETCTLYLAQKTTHKNSHL